MQVDEVPDGIDEGDTASLDSISSITSGGSTSLGDAFITAQIGHSGNTLYNMFFVCIDLSSIVN